MEAAATARTAASGLSLIVMRQYRMILGESWVQLIPGASWSSLGSQFKKAACWRSVSQYTQLCFPCRWEARFFCGAGVVDPDPGVCAPGFSGVLSGDCMVPPSFLRFVPIKLTLVACLMSVVL